LTISFFILCLFLKTSFLIPLYRPEICLHFYFLLLTSLKHRPLPLPPLPRRGGKPLTISFFILCLFLKTSFLIPHSSFLFPQSSFLLTGHNWTNSSQKLML
jgi:hypothetical protein